MPDYSDTTVLDRITTNIVETLGTVTPNGFPTLIPFTDDPDGVTLADGMVHVECTGETYEDPSPYPLDGFIASFDLTVFVAEVSGYGTTIDQRLNICRADIRKALMADVTRGNLAAWTRVDSWQKGGKGESFRTVVVTVTVYYRTLQDDPYTAA